MSRALAGGMALAAFGASAAFAQSANVEAAPIEAVTAGGERVRLFGNGRWEYADDRKAEAQRQAASAELARERSSQGGLFGIGRRTQEGDKDYNRGTLNPKMR